MTTIPVNGPNPYEVVIDHGLDAAVAAQASASGAAKVLLIHQPTLVAPAQQLREAVEAKGLEVFLAPVPDAEAGKTLAVVGQLWDRLGEHAFSRGDLVIGLGGGAVTDLAGFVAASWMRGINVIQVPTTLLAMVDAAVGGKTGINTAVGKNLVGAFHEPNAVFIDLDRLNTLPMEELIAGSAEIIKTGFIADTVILDRYEADPAACLRADGYLPELIARSVTVKASVVGQDLKESGLREILNYGHTFGHAVELRENYRWRHGNAVAVGMMFIARLAQGRGLIDAPLVDRHRRILESVGLPTSYPAGYFDELYAAMTRDKKNRGGHIRFVALTAAGSTTRLEGPSLAELQTAYDGVSEGS
ncbi:3-dehydroquinate synthase [Corynebacterium alimapuense]|uniref:3-dehydroquinate synthase n=1 Tax=Corynebacterium alimapuense TaxID=1576874 RepID=A0A3M8KBA1_9CORY|nr:3-dehydroquinate synthase [Corynebacterium alimapuense]RNE49738.1 3-dehydroquinate synthase [Corynebacterium alimapuense]